MPEYGCSLNRIFPYKDRIETLYSGCLPGNFPILLSEQLGIPNLLKGSICFPGSFSMFLDQLQTATLLTKDSTKFIPPNHFFLES